MALIRAFKTWEIGLSPISSHGLLLCFDRETAEQVIFAVDPKAAREMGKALIRQAREAENQKSRTPQ